MHRANGSSPPFLERFFFFKAEMFSLIFHPRSRKIPEKPILPPSPLGYLLLNLTHSDSVGWSSCFYTARHYWGGELGGSSCPPSASAHLPRQTYPGHHLYQVITCIRVYLQGDSRALEVTGSLWPWLMVLWIAQLSFFSLNPPPCTRTGSSTSPLLHPRAKFPLTCFPPCNPPYPCTSGDTLCFQELQE